MKTASAATLAILAARQAVLANLYDITLTTDQVYRFTDFPFPLNAAITPSGTKNLYQTGLTIKRGTITQQVGVQAGSVKLTLSTQWDSPNAPVLIAGYPILAAARYGFLDNALVQLSKLFMLPPQPGANWDTSSGAVGWFLGTIQAIQTDRLSLLVTVEDYLSLLGTQQMPRNLFQTGCMHQVYDAGCTLLKSAFTVNGAVATAGDGAHFTTNLTQADDWFALGVMTFTSGANEGLQATVASYVNADGAIVTRFPFPKTPAEGDAFSIYPGCDLQQGTCSSKFSNLAHFNGQPFIPVPETLLDGGTDNPPVQKVGAQAGQIIGSATSAAATAGKYSA